MITLIAKRTLISVSLRQNGEAECFKQLTRSIAQQANDVVKETTEDLKNTVKKTLNDPHTFRLNPY